MKVLLSLVVCLLACSTFSAKAQAARETTEASRRAAAPTMLVSPELMPDGSVTFRFRAPQAKEVKLSGQLGPQPAMVRDEQGVWTLSVPRVAPGVYEYHFTVDGMNVPDPRNTAIKPQRWPGTSILHIPASPPAPWDLQDIPHGVLHEHTYRSKALSSWRRLVVYTPPGYNGSKKYPVLYLAHGYSDHEGTWTVHGKAHWILDALIAAKSATPMIVVMPDAHALPPGAGAWESYATANTDAFCKELIEDIVPLVETSYKVVSGARHRAFAGLSMGGHHALTVALRHHRQFGWIGAFSSAPPPAQNVAEGLSRAGEVNRDLRLFWIGCGEKDFLFKRNGEFTALLKEKGIHHQYEVTPGDHSWPVWRTYLAGFAPKLFR